MEKNEMKCKIIITTTTTHKMTERLQKWRKRS